MGSNHQLFIGKVDRLSTSDNAMIKEDDIDCLGSRQKLSSEVNLGKLPQQVVGEDVVFAYDSGTYGVCLTKRWVTDDYLTEMDKKTGIPTDDIGVLMEPYSQDIIDELEDLELITVASVLSKESIVYKGAEIENVVVVKSVSGGEAAGSFLATMDGPLVPMGGTPVTVTGAQNNLVKVESCFTANEDAHPSVDDVVLVRVVKQLQTGTMGVNEAGIPIFIRTGQYQVGNDLKITVTEKTESHFVGEVVLDFERESFGFEDIDGVAVEDLEYNQRVICNGVPIDTQPVPMADLEPKGLVTTGTNTEAVEAKWDVLSAVENNVPIHVGDEITFEIRDAKGNSCIGSYYGYPVVCSGVHAFPPECEGEQIRGVIEMIEPDKATVSLPHLPETKQEPEIEIIGSHRQDGIAVVDGYLMKLPDVRFASCGDLMSVQVTNRGGNITEVSAGAYADACIGDEITFEVSEADGKSCIGSYKQFPVVCTGPKAFPSECEGLQVKGRVQEEKSDRLSVSLSHPPDTELHIEVIGQYECDSIGIVDGYLVKIPAAEVVSRGDELRVAVTYQSNSITQVSVAARDIFQVDDDALLVRLPETTGEYITIDSDIPVVTSHLPDIESPVTLGIADLNTDSVVPKVTALPESHVPDVGKNIEVLIAKVDETLAVGAGDELPVESVASGESDTIEVKVGDIGRNSVSGVAVGTGDPDIEHFHEYYVRLQSVELAYEKQDYEKVGEMLVSTREQLPSDELVIDAVLTAHIPLVDVLCATDITQFEPSKVEKERNRLVSLRDEIEETDIDEEICAYLHACDLELKATQYFIEGVSEATQDTRTGLQSIARGYQSKDTVTKGLTHIERAKEITSNTGFDTSVPSNELRVFIEEIRQSYPISVDELDQIPKPQYDPNWLGYFVSGQHTDTLQMPISDTDEGVETWTRPDVPQEYGVWSAGGTEPMGNQTAPGDGNKNLESTPANEEMDEKVDSIGASFGEKSGFDEDSPIVGESEADSSSSETSDSDTIQTTEDIEASEPLDDERRKATTVTNGESETSPDQEYNTEGERVLEETSREKDTEDEEQEPRSIKRSNTRVGLEDVDAGELTPTPVTDIEVTDELRELRQEAEEDATEEPVVEGSDTVSTKSKTGYTRSPKIRQYARTRADGVCEFCGDSAPFVKPDGEPYLEVHHVDELGDGGADDPSLVVALCPTCHMEIHYGRQGSIINEALREKLESGLGDVGTIE